VCEYMGQLEALIRCYSIRTGVLYSIINHGSVRTMSSNVNLVPCTRSPRLDAMRDIKLYCLSFTRRLQSWPIYSTGIKGGFSLNSPPV
jgi:hypothetical protein